MSAWPSNQVYQIFSSIAFYSGEADGGCANMWEINSLNYRAASGSIKCYKNARKHVLMLKLANGYVPFLPNNMDCCQKVSDRLFYAFYFLYLLTFISFSFTIKKSVILFKSNTTIILILIARNGSTEFRPANFSSQTFGPVRKSGIFRAGPKVRKLFLTEC